MSALGDKQQRRRLGSELRRLRRLADLSGRELGAQIGVDQSTISRIERGDQKTVKVAVLVGWCKATDAPDDQQAAILALAESILTGPTSWEAASENGSTDFAAEVADLEARTGLLSNYQPAAVPGLLQTPAYARRLLSSGPSGPPSDLASRVMGRIERQHILYSLRRHNFDKVATAKSLAIGVSSLYRKLDELQIPKSLTEAPTENP